MVANILPADSPTTPTLGMGSVGQNSTFAAHDHVAYQIKENRESSNMIANILPKERPSPTLGMVFIGKNSAFADHGHVAYQIKENQECSCMVANILPADTYPPRPRPWGWGRISQISTFFRKWSCCISN